VYLKILKKEKKTVFIDLDLQIMQIMKVTNDLAEIKIVNSGHSLYNAANRRSFSYEFQLNQLTNLNKNSLCLKICKVLFVVRNLIFQ
jgi:hypothetical protein